MPKDYEKIRRSLRKAHPDWSEKKVKEMAARTTIKQRKKAGKPKPRFHRKKK